MSFWKYVVLSLALAASLPLLAAATPAGFVKTTIQLKNARRRVWRSTRRACCMH